MNRSAIVVEFGLLFVLLPIGYRLSPLRIPVLPLLWVATLYAWWQLRRDSHFDRSQLWNAAPVVRHLPSILIVFVLAACTLWYFVHLFAPALEWSFVRQHPGFWAVVMILYPVISVYPQSLVYRAFFFERYAGLFPGRWTMIFASAAAFAFMHIIFRNWIAVALTFAGGILFAYRYDQTASLAASSFEHALYGCWLFTVGLGQYFYHGTIGTVGSLMKR